MLRKTVVVTAVISAISGIAYGAATEAQYISPYDPNVEDLTVRDAPPMKGIHWSREMRGALLHYQLDVKALRRPAHMTYHGGVIMPTPGVHPLTFPVPSTFAAAGPWGLVQLMVGVPCRRFNCSMYSVPASTVYGSGETSSMTGGSGVKVNLASMLSTTPPKVG